LCGKRKLPNSWLSLATRHEPLKVAGGHPTARRIISRRLTACCGSKNT
jgi:hypothetical protein